MEKKLASIYLDPSLWFRCCVRALKDEGKSKISRKQVQEWLNQQVVDQHDGIIRDVESQYRCSVSS